MSIATIFKHNKNLIITVIERRTRNQSYNNKTFAVTHEYMSDCIGT